MIRFLPAFMLVVACSSSPGPAKVTSPEVADTCAEQAVATVESLCKQGYLRACLRKAGDLTASCTSQRLSEIERGALEELGHPAGANDPSASLQNKSRSLHAAGAALLARNKLDEAILTLTAAQDKWPHPLILVDLGDAYARAKRKRESRVAYAQAAALAEARTGEPLIARPRDQGDRTYSAVTVHANGRLIAAAAGDRIFLWDLEQQRVIRSLRGHKAAVKAVVFTGDSSLVSASTDGQVLVWDIHRADYRLALTHDSDLDEYDAALAIDAKGARVAFGSGTGFSVYEVATGTKLFEKPLSTESLAFGGGEQLLSWVELDTCADDGECKQLKLWDGKGGLVRTVAGKVWQAAISPSGKRLALYGPGDEVTVHRIARWRRLRKFEDDSGMLHFLSEDQLIIGNEVHSVKSGKVLNKIHTASCNPDTAVSWNSAVVCAEWDSQRMTDPRSVIVAPVDGSKETTLGYRIGRSWVMRQHAFSPDGRYLAIVRPADVLLIDLEQWSVRAIDHGPRASSVDFDKKGQRLAVTGGKRISVWSVDSAELVWQKDFEKWITGVALSPDGSTVVTAIDGALHFFDAQSGSKLRELSPTGFQIFRLRYNTDGKRLFTMDTRNGASIIDASDAKPIVRHLEHIIPFNGTMSSDGEVLVTSSQMDFVAIHGPKEDEVQHQMFRDLGWANGVAVNDDHTLVATGDRYGTVRVHSITALRTSKELKGAPDTVSMVAFRPKGSLLLAGNEGPILTLFDHKAGKLLAYLVASAEGWALVSESAVAGQISEGHATQIYFQAGELELPGEVDWKTWWTTPTKLLEESLK